MPVPVVVLAEDAVHSFELSVVARVLGAACDRDGRAAYDVRVATVDGRPVRSDAGFVVEPAGDVGLLDRAELVVVVPSPQHTALDATGDPGAAARALGRLGGATRVASICLASYLLAAAGLLDGRRATTHWVWAQDFARSFPAVHVDPAPLFVRDGPVTTSAGAAASIDMLLDVIRTDLGAQAANRVARRLVVPSWRQGGQQQCIDHPLPSPEGAGGLADTLDWAVAHLDRPLGLDDLARHANLSRRTFTRTFRATMGTSPVQWLLARRADLARRLLETTDDTVDAVAHRAGFGSANALRAELRQATGVSPTAYRRAFRTVQPGTGADRPGYQTPRGAQP